MPQNDFGLQTTLVPPVGYSRFLAELPKIVYRRWPKTANLRSIRDR